MSSIYKKKNTIVAATKTIREFEPVQNMKLENGVESVAPSCEYCTNDDEFYGKTHSLEVSNNYLIIGLHTGLWSIKSLVTDID